MSDDVCWLSPLHPKALITKSASVLPAQTLAAKEAVAVASSVAVLSDGGGGGGGSDGEKDRDRG